MTALRLALDENVAHRAASLLRSLGLDADSAKELARLGRSDVQVLLLAAEAGQTVVTHNSTDFVMLHEAWVLWRRRWSSEVEQDLGASLVLSRHAGILIVPHLASHDLAHILMQFMDAAEAIADRLFAWSPARGWHELRF